MMNSTVTIREVGPRDGLQREAFVPTDIKVEMIQRLLACGMEEMEVTSFVSPKWVPQFADAEQVASEARNMRSGAKSLCLSALVPNQKGFDQFNGLDEVGFFIGATDTFNQKNVNANTVEHLERFLPVLKQIKAKGLASLAYVSVVCGCPYEGEVPPAVVVDLVEKLVTAGFDRISLGDTIGIGAPAQVADLCAAIGERVEVSLLAWHGHDTYGRGVANAWAAYQTGVRIFDSSVGGLGGCPFAPGAKGNVATEDLVDLFHRSKIDTGIDLSSLVDVVTWLNQTIEITGSVGGATYHAIHGANS